MFRVQPDPLTICAIDPEVDLYCDVDIPGSDLSLRPYGAGGRAHLPQRLCDERALRRLHISEAEEGVLAEKRCVNAPGDDWRRDGRKEVLDFLTRRDRTGVRHGRWIRVLRSTGYLCGPACRHALLMINDKWRPALPGPKPDEPISFDDWQARETKRAITAARLTLCARGIYPGHDPVAQLAELEIIDIVTGRGMIDDGRCPEE